MKSSIGIWIDTSNARIISPEKVIQIIPSNIENKIRLKGEGKLFGRFGKQFLSSEKSKKNRLHNQKIAFLNEVLESIKTYEQFLIFGPAQMKNELKKLILDNYQLKGKFIALKTTKKMTDNQLVAYVKDFYKKQ